MKKMLKRNLAILAMIAALGFVLAACSDDTPNDPLFENVTRGYSLQVSNLSSEDLVAYKGSLQPANRIGGIPAKTSNHGLPNDKKIFPETPTSFEMIFITRDQYNKNKNKPDVLNNQIFTRTYVFWNGSAGDNSKVYEISDKLGGAYKLQIWNTSNFNVEFRENGTSGPTIGYAPSGMAQSFLNVGPGDYLIFPVFQRFNVRRDIMETIIPMTSGNRAFRYEFGFEASDPPGTMQMLNLHSAVSGMTAMKSGVVAVVVQNNTGSGTTIIGTGIRFYRGTTPMLTPGGNQVISAGSSQEYTVDTPRSGDAYATEMEVAGWNITQGGYPAIIVDQNNSQRFTLKADYLYTISVTGSYEDDTLKAVINTNSSTPFEPEADAPGSSAGIEFTDAS